MLLVWLCQLCSIILPSQVIEYIIGVQAVLVCTASICRSACRAARLSSTSVPRVMHVGRLCTALSSLLVLHAARSPFLQACAVDSRIAELIGHVSSLRITETALPFVRNEPALWALLSKQQQHMCSPCACEAS